MLDIRYLLGIGAIAVTSQMVLSVTTTLIAVPAPSLAQSPPLQAGNQISQGSQINFNGRMLTVPWQQWAAGNGPRIGISDMGLIDNAGLQLLNSEDSGSQPVQWFTPPNQTLTLATRLTSSLRYLDLSDFARQFGWQWAIANNTLQITTPPTQIVGLRQSQQPWGDRLVIELSQPTPWQTTRSPQSVQLTFNATLGPSVQQQLRSTPGRFLSSWQLTPMGNQVQLKAQFNPSTAARVWSLSTPNRIVIDVRPDALVEQNILWAPGIRWRQQIQTVGIRQIPAVWLELNPKQPGVKILPILPTPPAVGGIAPLSQTAKLANVAGAINGGFFNRIRQLPLGAVRLNGRWLSGPILNRGAIAWDDTGNVTFGRLALRETVITPNGQRLPLTQINSGYVQAGIARYTPDWGPTYTPLTDNEIIVFVENNRVTSLQPLKQAGTTPVTIPVQGYILVLRSNRSATSSLVPGTLLQIESITHPPEFLRYPHILAAGPLLIQNQQIVVDAKAEGFSPAFATESAPRSAIAQRADGTLLLVTAHQRLDGSSLSLMDMAHLLQQMGATQALNLDGGSSTTLYLGGKILDRPPTTAARVQNGIGIFLQVFP